MVNKILYYPFLWEWGTPGHVPQVLWIIWMKESLPGYQSYYVAGATVFSSETSVVWFTRSPKELVLLQNEQENLRLDLLGCSPDFVVPPLDGSNDSVSLSVKWKARIVVPLQELEEWMRSSKQMFFCRKRVKEAWKGSAFSIVRFICCFSLFVLSSGRWIIANERGWPYIFFQDITAPVSVNQLT